MTEARFVRWTVPLLLLGSLVAGIGLPTPEPLPAVALGTRWVLYAERATLLFYGALLLLVPLVRAMRGQLPIELSLRGARYEEAKASEQALVALDDRLDKLEASDSDSSALVVGLARRLEEVEGLLPPGDSGGLH